MTKRENKTYDKERKQNIWQREKTKHTTKRENKTGYRVFYLFLNSESCYESNSTLG